MNHSMLNDFAVQLVAAGRKNGGLTGSSFVSDSTKVFAEKGSYSGGFLKSVTILGAMLLSLFAATTASAQNHPSATLSDTGIVQIPAGQPIAPTYLVDLSHLDFSSDQQMIDWVGGKSAEGFAMRAIPHMNKAVLMLDCQDHPQWSCTDWNGLLYAKFSENPLNEGSLNLTTNE